MATTTTYHAQLIKYDSSGNQSILNLKNTGNDVSISRSSNGNLPSTVTSAQTLANAFGSLAFKSALVYNDVKGIVSNELTVSTEGKIADARAIKTLADKIATNASNITKLNSNLANITLNSSGWTGSSVPYLYKISNSKITASNMLDLIINANSQTLVDALSSYRISGYSQSAGSVTIFAWGEKPSIDLSATLVVRGGL